MNLITIRSQIGNILDYNPDVQEYTDEVTNIINDVYLEMFAEHPWKFAQKIFEADIYADVTATDGIINNNAIVSTAAAAFEDWMEGNVLEIAGSTNLDGEYDIAKVVDSTNAYLNGYTGDGSGDTGVTFTIKQRYVDLPEDCVDVVNVFIRDYTRVEEQQVASVPRLEDEWNTLDVQDVGTPRGWIQYDDVIVEAPVRAPTLTDGGAGVLGVPDTGTYEVAYTFIYQNRESALSPSAEIAMTAGDEIDVSELPVFVANTGYEKQLYFKHPDTEAWYKAKTAAVDETTTTATLDVEVNWTARSERALEHGGQYQRIRLYPRQSAAYPLRVRYHYRAPKLIEDVDIPALPTSNHKYLVDRACEELFAKHNNLSQSEMYRTKAERGFLKLKNRFLTEEATFWVKKPFRPYTRKWRDTGAPLVRS